MSQPALTPRQREVLDFVAAFTAMSGYPPTVRQIGGAVGLSSSSSVHAHLVALKRKGYLKAEPGQVRTWRVALSGSALAPGVVATLRRLQVKTGYARSGG